MATNTLYISSCSAVILLLSLSYSAARKGIVMELPPEDQYHYVFNNRENDDPPLAEISLNEGKIRVFCDKYMMNAYDEEDNAITDFWLTVKTKAGDVELESFQIGTCNVEDITGAIDVKILDPVADVRIFQIYYRDKDHHCQQRDYKVYSTNNNVAPTFDVERSGPTKISEPKFWFSPCPISKSAPVVLGMHSNGKLRSLSLNKYSIAIKYWCEYCYALCGKFGDPEAEKYLVDVIAGEAIIDRIQVASCAELDLLSSIWFVDSFQDDPRWKTVIIQYKMVDESCYRRKYQYDTINHVNNRMWVVAKVKKEPAEPNDCEGQVEYTETKGSLKTFTGRYTKKAMHMVGRIADTLHATYVNNRYGQNGET
ncbi:uncharacterized protein LOC129001050 [Macrosteles quadrilineatus]|uniref:uncharacterized protein LOC129001050 n=1 Tax=Macrosteles quadrilineatus TaxID=74068 RepID=UPI0023E178C5|nr:uncharacterized protein LOC129001050 [Macrosteles quadrilineatus]